MTTWLEGQSIKKYEDASGQAERKQGSLIWTEVFLREVNRQSDAGILHFWPMEETVILGMMDARVPQLGAGLASIRQAAYQPVIRSLGGLAVVADAGVLNVTLILPNPQGHKIDLRESYQVMVDLIGQALAEYPVDIVSGEVRGSYCPGTYDLSIDGRKFAGLAQRIYQKAIAVSAYISVCGHQERRGQLVADFYRASFAPQAVSERFPQVDPSTMATLSDLLGRDLTLAEMQEKLERALMEKGVTLSPFEPSSENLSDFMELGQTIQQSMKKFGI